MYNSDSVNISVPNLWSPIHRGTCLLCYLRYAIYISLYRYKATPDEPNRIILSLWVSLIRYGS